jgi:catechol 2,3-dioxygenase-like lactoylglutathione lyase family enzyme
MPLTGFDHVNLRTAQLDAMIDWYGAVLGLRPGARPDFGFPGAWLYLGDTAVVHLVGAQGAGRAGDDLTLEHFAFRARDFAAFRDRLDAHGIAHSVDPVPGMPIVQINFRDPDGNHIHVDFDAAEVVAA